MAKKKLTPAETLELSKAFLKLSLDTGQYRLKNWDKLKKKERDELEDKQWTLFNTASDLNGASVVMSERLLEEDFKVLREAIAAMNRSIDKVKKVKQFIQIAAKAIAFGGALSAGHLPAVLASGEDLIAEVQNV